MMLAKAPGGDEAALREVHRRLLPATHQRELSVARLADDTGIP